MNDSNYPQEEAVQGATAALQGPAHALMAVAGLGIALALINLVLVLLGTSFLAAMGSSNGGLESLGGSDKVGLFARMGSSIVQNLLGLVGGGVILWGGYQMKQVRNYNLAMAAAVVAMVPCVSPCCWFGLPVGIWALVVLNKPEVKSAFGN